MDGDAVALARPRQDRVRGSALTLVGILSALEAEGCQGRVEDSAHTGRVALVEAVGARDHGVQALLSQGHATNRVVHAVRTVVVARQQLVARANDHGLHIPLEDLDRLQRSGQLQPFLLFRVHTSFSF